VRAATPTLTADDITAMRAANQRFGAALAAGDLPTALAADDELHRFGTAAGRGSIARHERLIELCASGAADAAAAVAFDTWHSLDTTD
jgi:DNA-binding GntR family transcriptional regulator